MSLKLPIAFINALRENDDLLETLGADSQGKGARIFPIARPETDEADDKLPYLVLTQEGIEETTTKDTDISCDECTIGIIVVASGYEEFLDLADEVRSTISSYIEDTDDFSVVERTLSISATEYDPSKPCYYATLTYQMTTENK